MNSNAIRREREYPSRSNAFAFRYARFLNSSKAVTEIGTDGCWLLLQLALQENKNFHRGPLKIWNEQLADTLGSTERTARRVRDKCVSAGWLHYDKGNRARGIYWVRIPDTMTEQWTQLSTEADAMNGTVDTDVHSTVTEVPLKRRLSKTVNSKQINVSSKDDGVRRFDARKSFQEFWNVVPRKVAKREAEKSFSRAAAAAAKERKISKPDAAVFITERMAAFSQCDKAKGDYCPYPASWLNKGCYDDDPSAWQSSMKKGGDEDDYERR